MDYTSPIRSQRRIPLSSPAAPTPKKRGPFMRPVSFLWALLATLFRSMTHIHASMASCLAVLSACVAASGYAAIALLLATRYYAPATSTYVRPLHFDYSNPVATAVAPLSPNIFEHLPLTPGPQPAPTTSSLIPKSRFLPKGQQVAVSIKLALPRQHLDLFQVTGELMTGDHHVAARSTRTYMSPGQSMAYWLAKQTVLLPLHILGWYDDSVPVKLRMFDRYEEKENLAITHFRVFMASRNATNGLLPPPPIYSAEVHVRLKLGLMRSILYWLRPGLIMTVIIGVSAIGTAFGGTASTIFFGILALSLHHWAKRQAKAAASPLGTPRARQLYGTDFDALPLGSGLIDQDYDFVTGSSSRFRSAMLGSDAEFDVGSPVDISSRLNAVSDGHSEISEPIPPHIESDDEFDSVPMGKPPPRPGTPTSSTATAHTPGLQTPRPAEPSVSTSVDTSIRDLKGFDHKYDQKYDQKFQAAPSEASSSSVSTIRRSYSKPEVPPNMVGMNAGGGQHFTRPGSEPAISKLDSGNLRRHGFAWQA